MIAMSHEDRQKQSREHVYALRRLLVRELQRSTHGISRRERVRLQRAFAQEWEQVAAERRFPELQRILRAGQPAREGAASDSVLVKLARSIVAGRQVPSDRTPVGFAWAAPAGARRELMQPIPLRPEGKRVTIDRPQPGPAQEDLFGPQPLAQAV